MNERELINRIRQNVIDTLELWSSKESQLDYQRNVPIAQVSAELFCQWSDDNYHPETELFRKAFNEKERLLLFEFDKVLNEIGQNASFNLPYITDFIKTREWKVLNHAAIETLEKIRN